MKGNRDVNQQRMAEPTRGSTIGLDLGDRWSRYCVIDSRGSVVKEDRVRTNPEALEETFRLIVPSKIVIEAGTHSLWVSRLLERLGHRVIVANARKVRLIYQSDRKNDRLDAQMLAKLGRVDVSLLAPVEHRSLEAQTDLTVVRSRDVLVSARVQMINAVRGLVKAMGGRLPASTTAAFAGKMASLIPPPLKHALTPLLKSIQHLSEQIRRRDRQVEELAGKKYPQTRLLQQVKGIGPLISPGLRAYAGQSSSLSEKPDGGQLPGPATEAEPIRRQFSTTGHHQVGQRLFATNVGAGGAVYSWPAGAGQPIATLGSGTVPSRWKEQ